MKNKRVYASPDVKGIYVLQAIKYQSASHIDSKAAEREAKKKQDEEELSVSLEIARDEGYKKGKLDAERDLKTEVEKVKSEYASLIALFQDAVHQLADKRDKLWQESESEVVKLVLAIAGKMIGEEISSDSPGIIKHVVKETLSYASGKKIVAIRLCPEDAKKIELLEDMKLGDQNIKILEDSEITLGGCVIETDFGNVDSRIETRWEEIRKVFLENKNEPIVH